VKLTLTVILLAQKTLPNKGSYMYEVAINFFSKAVTNMYAIMCPQAIVSIQRSKELSNERERKREREREG
jgi:hypothetical protein